MSLHEHLTLPITIAVAEILLSSLFPDWSTLRRILLISQKQIWLMWVLKASTVVLFLLLPIEVYLRVATDKHVKEKRLLFMESLKVIRQGVGIKLEQIYNLRDLLRKNKYFLNSKQEKTIKGLILTTKTAKPRSNFLNRIFCDFFTIK